VLAAPLTLTKSGCEKETGRPADNPFTSTELGCTTTLKTIHFFCWKCCSYALVKEDKLDCPMWCAFSSHSPKKLGEFCWDDV